MSLHEVPHIFFKGSCMRFSYLNVGSQWCFGSPGWGSLNSSSHHRIVWISPGFCAVSASYNVHLNDTFVLDSFDFVFPWYSLITKTYFHKF